MFECGGLIYFKLALPHSLVFKLNFSYSHMLHFRSNYIDSHLVKCLNSCASFYSSDCWHFWFERVLLSLLFAFYFALGSSSLANSKFTWSTCFYGGTLALCLVLIYLFASYVKTFHSVWFLEDFPACLLLWD